MKTAEILLDATAEIWEAYNKHPFVLGIQNGTLDREKFRYYIVQDYLYLEDYAKTHIKTKKTDALQLSLLCLLYHTGGCISILEFISQ